MAISASLVKDLREKTGVGLMDCKKALTESEGDIEEAIKYLREKGIAKASKKADRSTNEGKVFIQTEGNKGIILEVNCETDFVANNDAFQEFGLGLSKFLLANENVTSTDNLQNENIEGHTYTDHIASYIMKLGENISVKQFESVQTKGSITSYSHLNGKIGVIVAFDGEVPEDIGRDIAMQIAASNPTYISPDQVNQDELDKEREIIKNQAKNEGRPDNIIDKIVDGRINKYYKEVCLLEQPFVKDDKQTVKSILPKDTTVIEFKRYAI